MARKKKEVKEEVKEIETVVEEISPLPGEVIAKEVKEEVPAKKSAKTWYGFCRISGGLAVDILVNGEPKIIRFKSANTSSLAPDGTRLFQVHPDQFGVIELTEKEAKLCAERLKPMKCYQKGFIFITDSLEEGKQKAAQQAVDFPKQGTEQLTEAEVNANIKAFDEGN